MGTHPIFESDFDCLTEKSRNRDRTPVDWMECHLCGERHLYRQDIREHVLTRHKDQRVYQCQRCEFLTDDLRETMVDHMIGEHDVRHPLCENVDFQHLATGEFIKRMLSDAPIQNDSDNEVCLFK